MRCGSRQTRHACSVAKLLMMPVVVPLLVLQCLAQRRWVWVQQKQQLKRPFRREGSRVQHSSRSSSSKVA